MSQANFMRNLRMTMPQYVTNITSFKDSVRILKNKGLLHESYGGFNEEEIVDEMNMEVKPEESNDAEFDAILKQLEDEMAGEIAVKSDVLDEPLEEELNEGKGKELHPNLIHPGELRMGIRVEMEHTDDIETAKKIALDHIAENPYYYTALKLSGIESPTKPKEKAKKEVKSRKKKETVELIDKANQMQKVKMPKTVKEAMEVNPQGNLQPQGFPTAPDVDRVLKFMKGNKTFLSLIKNLSSKQEFTDFFREFLQLTDEQLDALKLSDSDQQNIFRKAVLDKRKETGVPAQIFAKNANIQKGINDIGGIKEKLRSMVREVLAEEAPSKKNAASEITAKAVDYIDDYNEGESKEYKKSQLENVFDSYEDKVGRRFDDSVFEDVIDMLKAKGYTMTMKETFDGRDNLTNISDDTQE